MPKKMSGIGTPMNFLDGKVQGFAHKATTTSGTPIDVWAPKSVLPPDHAYFCHGYTLRTWPSLGYTVASQSVWNVLEDEYEFLGFEHGGTPQTLQVGDVVAWFMAGTNRKFHYILEERSELTPDLGAEFGAADTSIGGVPTVEHSCRIVDLIGGVKSLKTIIVKSKTGFGPLVECSVFAVCAVYKGTIAYYRPQAAAAPATLVGAGSIFDSKGH